MKLLEKDLDNLLQKIYDTFQTNDKNIILKNIKKIYNQYITDEQIRKINNSKLNENIKDELTKQIDFLQKGILSIAEQKAKREAKLRKEREEKERDRINNTSLLSHFKNINYDIYVEKVYDDVFLEFRGYTGYREKKTIEYKKELGKYYPSVQEKIEQKSEMIVYRPNGFDIRIEVKIGLHSYTITIGHKYTKNINLFVSSCTVRQNQNKDTLNIEPAPQPR